MARTPGPLAIVLAASTMLVTGCGSEVDRASAPGKAELGGEITVSAAASLTEAYTEIGRDFEAANPGTTIRFNFDSSGALARQILDGAPVDVYASADEADMAELTEAGLIEDEPTVFARNRLAIVTQPANPTAIATLADLADAGVIALCAETAPCGTIAAQVLARAGVSIPESRVTRGQSVKPTLTAVSEGDAVAGIVYVTDAASAGGAVATVAIPEDQNAIATYPVGVLTDAANPDVARAFADHVASDDALLVLKELGFLPPS